MDELHVSELIAKLRRENDQLTAQLKETTSAYEYWRGKYVERGDENYNAKESIRALQITNADLNVKITKLEECVAMANGGDRIGSASYWKNEFDKISAYWEAATAQLKAANVENDELKERNANLDKANKDRDAAWAGYKEDVHNDAVAKLKTISNLKEKLNAAVKTAFKYENEITVLHNRLANVNDDLRYWMKIAEERSAALSKDEAIVDRMNDLEATNDTLTHRLGATERHLANAEQTLVNIADVVEIALEDMKTN